jgi:hypothetical protein
MKNHGEFSKWLLHDDQKELFEIIFAVTLNVFALALTALLLWPLGRPTMAFRLAKGHGILWVVICVTFLLLNRIQRFFRVDLYDHPNAFLISNIAVSCFLLVGWAAFAALTVHGFVAGAPVWVMVILYFVGVLSCLVAFFAVTSFYQGHVYKLIGLPLALCCFAVFSVWPAGGRATYGWFFELF